MLYLVCQQQERGTLLSQFPRRSSPSVALRHSTPVKILLPRLLPFFFVGSGFVPGIELPVQHGVELLLQALPDFFFKIILAPQMVHGEVDEQIIGDLYAFIFLSFPIRDGRNDCDGCFDGIIPPSRPSQPSRCPQSITSYSTLPITI